MSLRSVEVTSWHIHTFSSSRWERRLHLVTSRLHKQVSAPHPPRLYQRVALRRRFWKVGRRRRVPGASLAKDTQTNIICSFFLFIIIISPSDSWRLIAQMHTHTRWIIDFKHSHPKTWQFVFLFFFNSTFHTCRFLFCVCHQVFHRAVQWPGQVLLHRNHVRVADDGAFAGPRGDRLAQHHRPRHGDEYVSHRFSSYQYVSVP